MGSIYNTPTWDDTGGTDYVKFDVVSHDSKVWYAILPSNASAGQTPAVGNAWWGGQIDITIAGTTTAHPYFLWSPSYNISTSHQPRIKAIQYGEGYEQRLKDGINNNKLEFSLSFEQRNEAEATAILHFLNAREGYESFYFKAPAPYGRIKKFVCKQYSSTFVFADNYTIQATFQEVS